MSDTTGSVIEFPDDRSVSFFREVKPGFSAIELRNGEETTTLVLRNEMITALVVLVFGDADRCWEVDPASMEKFNLDGLCELISREGWKVL